MYNKLYETLMRKISILIKNIINEAYDKNLKEFFNNKDILLYDHIMFDEECNVLQTSIGKGFYNTNSTNWLGSIKSDESIILKIGLQYSFREIINNIKTLKLNRECSSSLFHLLSYIAKIHNLNITDYIWADWHYPQYLHFDKDTFKTSISNVTYKKNSTHIVEDFYFVIENIDIDTKFSSSADWQNIICADAKQITKVIALIYIGTELYKKLCIEHSRRNDSHNFKDPLIARKEYRHKANNAFGKGDGEYNEDYRQLKNYYKDLMYKKSRRIWDDNDIAKDIHDNISSILFYNHGNDKIWWRWLKKKDEQLYKAIKYYLTLKIG